MREIDFLRVYTALFGPATIVCIFFSLKKIFEHFKPRINPTGIDGIVYLGLHTLSLLLILSFGGVIFLRLLKSIQRYLRMPWDMLTPPFRASIGREKWKLNQEIVKKARSLTLSWLSVSIVSSFLFPIIGIVPWREGTMYTGRYEAIAPTVTIPEIIYQLPILGDLVFLGDFIASPDTFGYILISVTMAFMIIGFWNATFLFYQREFILNELETNSSWFVLSLTWGPHIGLLLYVVLALEYGVLWFL